MSAISEAKADTKDSSDGFTWNKGDKFPLRLLQMSQSTILLPSNNHRDVCFLVLTIIPLEKSL